jgi:hypothetical protein
MGANASIIDFFLNDFNISDIYDAGWYAAESWMLLISGLLLAISLAIRSVEEKHALLTTGKSDLIGAATSAIIITVFLACYFTFATLIIDFFNAIYSSVGSETHYERLQKKLDLAITLVNEKETDYAWSDIVTAPLSVISLGSYYLTYLLYIFVSVALNIAHASIVSFLIFWGAVALPLSITNGFKMLTAFRVMTVTVLIWPIVQAFLTYVIAYAFGLALDKYLANMQELESVGGGYILVFYGVFTVINLIIVAVMIASYMIAQSLSNGSGNIVNAVNSFAMAGVGAAMLLSKGAKQGGAMAFSGANGFAQDFMSGYSGENTPEASSDMGTDNALSMPSSSDNANNIPSSTDNSVSAPSNSDNSVSEGSSSNSASAPSNSDNSVSEGSSSNSASAPSNSDNSVSEGSSSNTASAPSNSDNSVSQDSSSNTASAASSAGDQGSQNAPVQSVNDLSSSDNSVSQSSTDNVVNTPSSTESQLSQNSPEKSVNNLSSSDNSVSQSSTDNVVNTPSSTESQLSQNSPEKSVNNLSSSDNSVSQSSTDNVVNTPSNADSQGSENTPEQIDSKQADSKQARKGAIINGNR